MRNAWQWLWRSYQPNLFGKIIISAFVLVQCLDGIFTYVIVKAWGLDAELNPLVGLLMSVLGIGLGLIAVKLVAVGGGLFLHWRGRYNIVAMITVFYLIVLLPQWTDWLLIQ